MLDIASIYDMGVENIETIVTDNDVDIMAMIIV